MSVGRMILSMCVCLAMAWTTELQAQQWEWATQAGGAGNDYISTMDCDKSGNIWVAGSTKDSIRFGSIVLKNNAPSLHYLAQYNAHGEVMQAHIISTNAALIVNALKIDYAGNLLLNGWFADTVTIGTTTKKKLTAVGSFDVFIAKFNSSGEIQWAVSAGGTGFDYAGYMACDAKNNIYITGDFHSYPYQNSAGKIMVAKYDADGNKIWLRTSRTNTNGTFGNAINVDSEGNSYVVGQFFNSLAFDSQDTIAVSTPESCMFIAKFDAAGNQRWLRYGSGSGYMGGNWVDIDRKGNCYIAGFVRGQVAFDDIQVNAIGGFTYEVFLAKYDANGKVQWVNKSVNTSTVSGIFCSEDDNCYMAGAFAQNITWGNTTLNNKSGTGSDIYMVAFDASGAMRGIQQIGNAFPMGVTGVKLVGSELIIAGSFRDTVNFDATHRVQTDTGKSKIYIAKQHDFTSSVAEEEQNIDVQLFPHPAENLLQWKDETGASEYSIYDNMGRVVLEGKTAQHNAITVESLSAGVYCLRLHNRATKQSVSALFIKQ